MSDARDAVFAAEPVLMARRLFAEAWGTFLLVLVAVGGGVVAELPAGSDLTLQSVVLAPGIMVMAIIYFMGAVSGAHLNPAVTWAFALRGNFPWPWVPLYVLAQAAGAFAAAAAIEAMFGGVENGMTEPGPGITDAQTFFTELLLTTGLVTVILGTATKARNIGPNAALAVGGYIGLVAVWAAPVSGASMNPMRSFAPAVLSGQLGDIWIYLIGPVVGATFAVAIEFILRGRPTSGGDEAAQGTLSPDNPAAK